MDSGNIIQISNKGSSVSSFTRTHVDSNSEYDEKWLQEKIFEHIELLTVTDPVYDHIKIVPLCREFSLHDGIRTVFLDILAISETGKLILVECKLWKNPQARREVLSQIIEYASLLQSLSYSDFSARLKKYIPSGDEDPLSYRFKELGLKFDESVLIDRVSNSLKLAKFQLVIAGDGIRTDIINLINSPSISGVMSDICLLEVGLFKNSLGDICLLPSMSTKTETIQKTVLVSAEGIPMTVEEDFEEDELSGHLPKNNSAQKDLNNEFFSKLIQAVKFDHPDQEPLKKGGNNWARSPLPAPFKWLTAYRIQRPMRIGIFIVCEDDRREELYEFLLSNLERFRLEIDENVGIELAKGWSGRKKQDGEINFYLREEKFNWLESGEESSQIDWFNSHINKFVDCLRPIAKAYRDSR
ncbi:hypothetical protein N8933_04465 [Pseudomonadales bacterium]|nr:hypothetical protein [Pseudomonadales bacterium]